MNLNKFLRELKRRNVFKVATAYAVTAWLIIQVVVAIEKPLGIPDGFDTIVIWVLFIGFPVALIIAWIYEWTNQGLKKTGDVDDNESITSTTGKKLNRIIIASLSMVVVLLLVERIFFAGDLFTEEIPTIAVLPFENRSSDPENEYFAQGIAEEIINELAQTEDLKIIARTSSFRFKDKNLSIEEIADKLGVENILTGTVRKDGDDLRITTELIKAEAGITLWSKAFERNLKDIFQIQSEIARNTKIEILGKLLPKEATTIEGISTKNTTAYDLYLKANDSTEKDVTELQLKIELLKQSIEIDPEFIEAHAGLVFKYSALQLKGNLDIREAVELMKYHAETAYAIDNNNYQALRAMARYIQTDFSDGRSKLEEAENYFRKALKVSPNRPQAMNGLQILLRRMNRTLEADSIIFRAWSLDPLNPVYTHNAALIHSNRGEKRKAIEIVEQGIKDHPTYTPMRTLLIGILISEPYGRIEDAWIASHKALKEFPTDADLMWRLVRLSLRLDLYPTSQKYLSQFQSLYPNNFTAMRATVNNNLYKENYEAIFRFAEFAKKEFGELATKPLSGMLSTVYFLKGDYEKTIELIEANFPEVIEESFDFKGIENLGAREDLMEVLSYYTMAKIKLGEREEVSSELKRIENEYYYFDSIQDIRVQQSRNILDEIALDENITSTYRLHTFAYLSLLSEDADHFLEYAEELYFERKAFAGLWRLMKINGEYKMLEGNIKYEAFKERIREDVHQRREKVISYLREQGEWQDSWDAELE
ncbi:MAG: hypothetical protein HEP71_03485 [Roseivirga sp.]|nr:hypothetical protein [Roseivirga sp.]